MPIQISAFIITCIVIFMVWVFVVLPWWGALSLLIGLAVVGGALLSGSSGDGSGGGGGKDRFFGIF